MDYNLLKYLLLLSFLIIISVLVFIPFIFLDPDGSKVVKDPKDIPLHSFNFILRFMLLNFSYLLFDALREDMSLIISSILLFVLFTLILLAKKDLSQLSALIFFAINIRLFFTPYLSVVYFFNVIMIYQVLKQNQLYNLVNRWEHNISYDNAIKYLAEENTINRQINIENREISLKSFMVSGVISVFFHNLTHVIFPGLGFLTRPIINEMLGAQPNYEDSRLTTKIREDIGTIKDGFGLSEFNLKKYKVLFYTSTILHGIFLLFQHLEGQLK